MESKPPTYGDISLAEDQEELLSSTEVDDSLAGDDKDWHRRDVETARRPSRRRALLARFRRHKWLLDTGLLLAITGLLLVLVWDRRTARAASWQVGGDFTGASPASALLLGD